MLHACAVYLTKMLLKNNAISEENQDIYIYGWEMILSTAGSVAAILLVAIVFKQLPGTVLFLLFFLTLRAYAGGYHANSYLGCFSSSLVVYLVFLTISLKMPVAYMPIGIWCLTLLSVALVFLRAPQDNPNKPITTEEERKRLTKISRLLALGQAGLVVLLSWLTPSLTPYLWWATLGMTDAGGTLLISNWKNK